MTKIPVTVITGFLGAGKTTLINRIISQNPEYKFGIVVNEFGDIPLETSFYQQNEDEIIELNNGCICCVARTDFVDAIERLISSKKEINYIIIEASGLSDPFLVIQTFDFADIAKKYLLDSIICVVDANYIKGELEQYDTVGKQIRNADFILLSKTDNLTKLEVEKLSLDLNSFKKSAKVLNFDQNLDTSILINKHSFSFDDFEKDLTYSVKHESFEKYFFESSVPMDYFKVINFFNSMPEFVVRAKGFFYFANSPLKMKYLVQYAGGRKSVDTRDWKSGEEYKTGVLFLGNQLDKKMLEEGMNAAKYKEAGNVFSKFINKINDFLNK